MASTSHIDAPVASSPSPTKRGLSKLHRPHLWFPGDVAYRRARSGTGGRSSPESPTGWGSSPVSPPTRSKQAFLHSLQHGDTARDAFNSYLVTASRIALNLKQYDNYRSLSHAANQRLRGGASGSTSASRRRKPRAASGHYRSSQPHLARKGAGGRSTRPVPAPGVRRKHATRSPATAPAATKRPGPGSGSARTSTKASTASPTRRVSWSATHRSSKNPSPKAANNGHRNRRGVGPGGGGGGGIGGGGVENTVRRRRASPRSPGGTQDGRGHTPLTGILKQPTTLPVQQRQGQRQPLAVELGASVVTQDAEEEAPAITGDVPLYDGGHSPGSDSQHSYSYNHGGDDGGSSIGAGSSRPSLPELDVQTSVNDAFMTTTPLVSNMGALPDEDDVAGLLHDLDVQQMMPLTEEWAKHWPATTRSTTMHGARSARLVNRQHNVEFAGRAPVCSGARCCCLSTILASHCRLHPTPHQTTQSHR